MQKRTNLFATILWVGFLVGLFDITAAIINFKINSTKSPAVIFQYIASAVFGKKAYSGDTSMIVMGALFHFLIAYTFTILFFLIYPQIQLLLKKRFPASILYGIFIDIAFVIIFYYVTGGSRPEKEFQYMIGSAGVFSGHSSTLIPQILFHFLVVPESLQLTSMAARQKVMVNRFIN